MQNGSSLNGIPILFAFGHDACPRKEKERFRQSLLSKIQFGKRKKGICRWGKESNLNNNKILFFVYELFIPRRGQK